MREEQNTKLG